MLGGGVACHATQGTHTAVEASGRANDCGAAQNTGTRVGDAAGLRGLRLADFHGTLKESGLPSGTTLPSRVRRFPDSDGSVVTLMGGQHVVQSVFGRVARDLDARSDAKLL